MEATIGKIEKNPYDLGKTSFLILVHIGALLAIYLEFAGIIHFSWRTYTLALVWFTFSCASITAGYHRLFSHPTYRATKGLRLFYLLWSEAAVQGSALDWASKHRAHHKYVDTDDDPYSIKRGFWYAHWGWVFRKTHSDFKLIPDLVRDPLVAWQHRFDNLLAMIMTFAIPAGLGSLWGEGWEALFLVGFLRLLIQWHMTFCVNSVAHYWGNQDYSRTNSSRGSWFTAFITFGEGQSHNFHHAHPGDYRTGVKWYDFDPAKWWIWACSRVGLASRLQRVKLAR